LIFVCADDLEVAGMLFCLKKADDLEEAGMLDALKKQNRTKTKKQTIWRWREC
jgi:hypothetical protein